MEYDVSVLRERFERTPKNRQQNGCVLWGGPQNGDGYGLVRFSRKNFRAHRVAYLLRYGFLPGKGLVLDHLCRNRLCVNPEHLEPVTIPENVNRGDRSNQNRGRRFCKFGHEFTPENTYVYQNGKRACRACIPRHQEAAKRRAASRNGGLFAD